MRDVLRDRQQWGRHTMVSTGSAAATLAALDVLDEGGCAFDAALTASAVMTVTMPMASGPGGDAVAVLHVAGGAEAVALTGLGRAPMAATIDAFARRGHSTVPIDGILSAVTPGLLDAWFALHRAYGTMPLHRLLAPAVRLAEDGVVVTGQTTRWIKDNLALLIQPGFAEVYAPCATRAAVGSLLRQPGLGGLYRMVGEAGVTAAEVRRAVGERIARVSTELDGLLATDDFVADTSELTPAATAVIGGHRVASTPAPTQGPLLLQNLLLYERRAEGLSPGSAESVHLLAEIVNQTYGWRLDNLADPRFASFDDPLDPGVVDSLDAGVDPERRSPSRYAGHYSAGDTTHLAVVDRAGNAVSWVQSLGLGFGAGVGVPEWGLLLGNRLGRSTTLNPSHANRCEPGKRPVNTILPWSVSTPSGVRWLGGTPGGDGQTQWNAQVLGDLLVHGASPAAALGRPRWTYFPGSDKVEAALPPQLHVDADMPAGTREDLRQRGHDVVTKASVGGVLRVLGCAPDHRYGLDDGRQEGLTAGR
ncbi:gamma-glutamyltransferase family protein [Krasilnikovia sp. MM14-A1004]|uniref:gamma-glutamyltransferase family protein n=1 Tax=Krasilnikovia sp. MM14-A1004 TaxID=3373541 RepID=UPI00399CE313